MKKLNNEFSSDMLDITALPKCRYQEGTYSRPVAAAKIKKMGAPIMNW